MQTFGRVPARCDFLKNLILRAVMLVEVVARAGGGLPPEGEGKPFDKTFVWLPIRLAALHPSLRGQLLMHALANCFGEVISHLSTNSRGQEVVGAFLTYLVDSVPAVRPVVETLELPMDNLTSEAVLLARTQSGLRQTELAKEAKAIEVTC